MKLSTTTGDLRGYAENMADQLALFEGTGFRIFDLSLYDINCPGSSFLAAGDAWKREVEAVGETAYKLGFSFSMSHSPSGKYFVEDKERDNLILSTKRSIEACGMLGIKNIVVHSHASDSLTPTGFMEANRDFNSLFFDVMEKHGVNVLIENSTWRHSRDYYLYSGNTMREYIEYVNHPMLFACWDTGHAHLNKTTGQYEDLIALGKLLRGVHIADNLGEHDDHTAPLFGSCNFAPIVQALLDIGYNGTFNFESSRIVFNDNSWPSSRMPWSYKGQYDTRLSKVPLHIKKQSVALCYEIGKYILEQYDCYEY